MQISLPFSALLGSVLVALSAPSLVGAMPVAPDAGLITLPLTRVHSIRSDVDPELQHAQHLNRALRRHARLTGRAEPSTEELRAKLHRRMYLLPNQPDPTTKKWTSLDGSGKTKRFVPTDKHVTGEEKWEKLNEGAPAVNNALALSFAAAATNGGFSKAALDAQQKNALNKANKPTTANTVALDVEGNDVGYISPIQIGTPPRDFNLLMDSGSADLWVGSEDKCVNVDTKGDCGKHNFLGAKSSSSFKASNDPFKVTYGSGAAAGFKVQDTLTISGLKLEAHTFGVANQETKQFADSSVPFDGLMGLAKSTLSQQKTPTPPEALQAKGLIKEAIVSYRISRVQDNKNDGQVTFGGIDPTTVDSKSLVTVDNVSKTGFWEAPHTVSVNGKDLGLTGRTAILDTGTTLILAPAQDALALHKAIPGAKQDGQGGFTVPCTTTASIELTFAGKSFAIDPRDLLFAPVDPNNLQGDCLSGISSGEIGGPNAWLVGDVFLKNVIFASDVTRNKITLGKHAA